MSTITQTPSSARDDSAPDRRVVDLRDVAKFGVAAAVLAMFVDAAVGHALLWENDPYWTYWVTDTFLLAVVFMLGTAWLGIGARQGAIVAAVQTLILTTYYWALSPIGLPEHAEWLDLQHTWVTGPPVHFGVYYLGYLVTLWAWRRRPTVALAPAGTASLAATQALAVGGGVTLVAGLAQTVALGDYPGVTWFVVRTIVATVATLVWWAAVGRDRRAGIGGALLLAFVLTTYTHYLAPVGLPDTDLRILDQDPPPADVHWLSYEQEWLVAFPITLVAALVAFAALSDRTAPNRPVARRAQVVAGGCVAAIVACAAAVALVADADDRTTTVTAAGDGQLRWGDGASGPGAATVDLMVEEATSRRTPHPPHDQLRLRATLTGASGEAWEIRADQPLISEPRGRFGTWYGAGYDKWHHGRSGIGSPDRPAIRSEVAIFALGDLHRDGTVVATGIPVHAATIHDGGAELAVGDPASPIPGLPGGYVTATWADRDGASPENPERARNLLGSVVLASLIALTGAALRSERRAGARTAA